MRTSRKIIFFIFLIYFFLFFSSQGEEIFSLYFLKEKDRFLITPIFKNQEIYISSVVISSLFKASFELKDNRFLIKDDSREILGEVNKKEILIDGETYKLLEPIIYINQEVYLPARSLFSFLGYRLIAKDKILYIVQVLDEVSFEKNKIYFKIKSKDEVNYKSFTLKEPNRLVFDLYDCIIVEKKELSSKIPGIKLVRYSQFSIEPYIVRVVIEFASEILEPRIIPEKGKIILEFPEKKSEKVEEEIRLLGIRWEKGEDLYFYLTFDSSFTYSKGILRDPERIFYDFPKVISQTDTIVINSNPVEKIRFGFPYTDSKVLRVVFDLYTATITYEEVFTNGLKISFPIEENKEEKTKKMLVIIDPGHGGKDPGAVYSNVLEKDINLSISLKLSDLLKESGYNVVLLREKDETISLDDRVSMIKEILNKNIMNEEAILLSIHTNSASFSEIKGVEIFYATDFSITLAKIISETLSKHYSVRTLRQGKFYVLSRIPIPGIIVEVGFLSNEEERRLLISEDFQREFVNRLKEAIENFNNRER